MRKIILVVLLLGLLGFCSFIYWRGDNKDTTERTSTATSHNSPRAPEAQQQTVRLIAVGDMLPHDTVNLRAETATGYNYLPFFSEVDHIFNAADIGYCNQEAPSAGADLGISGYPTFNAPAQFPADLGKLGCNVINLANNHTADKGVAGINATLDAWKGLDPLAVSGINKSQSDQNVSYFTKNGIKFAFAGFTEVSNNTNVPGYALNKFDKQLVNSLVKKARRNADFVIVSAHWGVEDSPSLSSSQRSWARTLADAGADLVLGAGPHVLQPVEAIKANGRDTWVWYSLGNFLSSQLKLEELIGGIAQMDIISNQGEIEIKNVRFIPTYMHYEWTKAEASSEDLLKRDNLKIYPLYAARTPLSKSLFNTTVEAQYQAIKRTFDPPPQITIVERADQLEN